MQLRMGGIPSYLSRNLRLSVSHIVIIPDPSLPDSQICRNEIGGSLRLQIRAAGLKIRVARRTVADKTHQNIFFTWPCVLRIRMHSRRFAPAAQSDSFMYVHPYVSRCTTRNHIRPLSCERWTCNAGNDSFYAKVAIISFHDCTFS